MQSRTLGRPNSCDRTGGREQRRVIVLTEQGIVEPSGKGTRIGSGCAVTTSHYIIDEQLKLAERNLGGDSDPSRKELVLIDLHCPDEAELRNVLHGIVPGELLAKVMDSSQTAAHLALYEDALLLRLPVATSARASSILSIIVTQRITVTVRHDDIAVVDATLARLRKAPLHSAGTAMILFELADRIVDDDTTTALALRRRVDDLEQGLEGFDAEFDLDQASACRREAVALEAVLEDQRGCLGGLQTTSMENLRTDEFQSYLRDVISHLDHNIRVADRVEDRLDALQQHYILKLQDRQNNRLQLLTVVSAIFLPLTLITGIYGMNFQNMPELSWRFGYALVLLFMLVIAALLLFVLYRKQWFR